MALFAFIHGKVFSINQIPYASKKECRYEIEVSKTLAGNISFHVSKNVFYKLLFVYN